MVHQTMWICSRIGTGTGKWYCTIATEYVALGCKHLRAVHRVADLRTTLGALKSLHKMGSPSDLLINRFSYSVYIHAKNLVLLMNV